MNATSLVLAGSLLAASLLPAQGLLDRVPQHDAVPPPSRTDGQPDGPVQGRRLPRLLTPVHTAAPDHGIEYGIWAAGDDYKASFHGGMTFVPYLGANYPVTQSLHWQTTSAQLGTHELLASAAPVPVQGEFRYEYRFGVLTEAYDVRHEGLEQSFVLHERPAAGDLVIRGAVTSRLHASNVGSAHQALVFADDQGNDIVRYGAAVAIDALGNEVPVDTSYRDRVVTLTVPAAWLERAALPVRIDPILGNVQLAGSAYSFMVVDDVAIARRGLGVHNRVMVAHTRPASLYDSDLFVELVDDDFGFNLSGWQFAEITSNWSTDQVSCAYVGGSDRWAVVFRRLFTGQPVVTSELRCHVRDGADTSLLTNVGALNGPAGHNDWRPDVGGVQTGGIGHEALVVFQREDNTATGGAFDNTALSDVRGCLLDTTTTNGTFGTSFPIHSNSLYDNERPSVNHVAAGGQSFSWVVVFQRFLDGASNEVWHLLGARVGNDGLVASGTWTSDIDSASPAQHQLGPIVEGTSGRYAVAFTTVSINVANSKLTAINGRKVQLERFNWTSSSNNPGGDHAPVELATASDRRFETSGLGYDTNDRSHWTLGIREIAPGTPAEHYVRVGYNGESTESGDLYYSLAQPSRGACVFDDDHDRFLFAFGVDTVLEPLLGQTVTYIPPGTKVASGNSCSSASLSWTGSQQIGSEFGEIGVSGAPAVSLHLMQLSLASENVLLIHPAVAAGCRLLVDLGAGYLGMFPTGTGANPSWQLPLPEFLAAQDLFFQDWYLDTTNLLYSTERIKVPIVK